MMAITLALVVTSILCLQFDSTRLVGVVGVALLICLHPLLFLAFLGLGGVVFCYFHHHARRTIHVLPNPDHESD